MRTDVTEPYSLPGEVTDRVLASILGFVARVRALGVPVSLVEVVDAVRALRHVDLGDRDQFRRVLTMTMVKRSEQMALFSAAFDLSFPGPVAHPLAQAEGGGASDAPVEPRSAAPDLLGQLAAALRARSTSPMDQLAAASVATFAGLAGGSVGTERYHYYRIMRQLDLSGLLQRAMRLDDAAGPMLLTLDRRLEAAERDDRLEDFRAEVAAELRRRLVELGGLEAAYEALHERALEVDFLRAGPADLAAMRNAVRPLARRLAARAARRRRYRRSGRPDVRRTMRRALSTGGVPLDPALRRRHSSRPNLLVLCDVSGSVAEFAKFTLSLLHALHAELPRLRSFVFVDGPQEVTDLVESSPGIIDTRYLLARPGVVRTDGHSDYGAVLRLFLEEQGRRIAAQTTVIVCGDARANYRPPRPDLLRELRSRVRHIYWLNPEPRAEWDTTDSVMSVYARHCDCVAEVRNLGQLSDWVERFL